MGGERDDTEPRPDRPDEKPERPEEEAGEPPSDPDTPRTIERPAITEPSGSVIEDTRVTRHVEVTELLTDELGDLHLSVLSGESHLDNRITHPRVQKPGLAFAGYYPYIKAGRVQIVGESETAYLGTLSRQERHERFERITALPVPVFVITKGLAPLPGFLRLAQEREVPVLSSTSLSSTVIKRISWFLEEHLVPVTRLHGVLLDIYGLGVLLIGESGIGKSESALDLIARGHSLVSDDLVTVKRFPNGELVGYNESPLKHHMELRGLGIINVQDLFGLAAVRERKPIDLVIELESWDESRVYDRLGLDETLYEILEVPCPYIRMPVALGRNISILVEIAARNHVLKLQGHHSAREFAARLERELERKAREGTGPRNARSSSGSSQVSRGSFDKKGRRS